MGKGKTVFQAASFAPQDKIIPYTGVRTNYRDYIPFGFDNLFPNALALFSRKSPKHRGVINSKVSYCMGDGILPIADDDQETTDLLSFVNFDGETLNDVQQKLFLDRFMGGNYYIELITDKNRTFLWFNHIDYTKCRLSKDAQEVLIHPDWSKYTGRTDKNLKSLPIYPKFKPDSEKGVSAYRSVFRVFDYEPEFVFYGIPSWIAGKDSVQIDFKTNKWNLGRLKNSFSPGGTFIVPVKDAPEGKKVIDNIKKHYTGDEKQGKTLVLVKSRATTNEKADQAQYIQNTVEEKGSWGQLHDRSTDDIVVAHSWYRSLAGITDNTGFDTERILNEYQVALSTFITSEQEVFIRNYQKLYKEVLNKEFEITFKNTPPVRVDSYLRIWEIRKKRGESYDENDKDQQGLVIPKDVEIVGTENTKE